MLRFLILLIPTLAWIAGCGANAPPGSPFFTGAGVSAVTYGGVLPCLDCTAQNVVITIFPDGVYRLRRTYENAGDEEDEDVYELGQWYLAEEDGRLELRGGSFGSFPDTTKAERRMPEAAIAELRVHEGGRALLLHETEDAKRSAMNQELVRLDDVDFIPGPMFLRGMFVYEPNGGTFADCLTEKEYPVAMGAEREAMEIAYLGSKLPKEQPVLAGIEGRFALREPQPGALPEEQLVVERFDRILPGDRCFPDTIATALLGTEWRLVEIDGSPVSIAAQGTEPTLVLSAEGNRVSGTTGCNRFFGQFELPENEGKNGLRIPGLQTTRMACDAPVMDLEAAFVKAMAGISFYAIVNHVLELRDEKHDVRLRFQAGRGP